MWLSNTATTAMMLPIANAILESLFGNLETLKENCKDRSDPEGGWGKNHIVCYKLIRKSKSLFFQFLLNVWVFMQLNEWRRHVSWMPKPLYFPNNPLDKNSDLLKGKAHTATN